MRTIGIMLGVLGLLLGTGTTASAEEPQLDLVRGLRAQGLPDYALEYIEKLSAQKPSAELAALLTLEAAKARVDLAALEPDEGKRGQLLAQARAGFDSFLKANTNHPLAPQANLEIARLISAQGKAELEKARRFADKKAQMAEAAKARLLFAEAAGKLQEAAGLIDAKLKQLAGATSPADLATKNELFAAGLHAQLEQGTNLFYQARTYENVRDSGKAYEQARVVFQKLGSNPDQRWPLVWIGRAWGYRCLVEMDTLNDADKLYKALTAETHPAADSAKRLVRYFHLLRLENEAKNAQDLTALRTAAEEWLRTYRAQLGKPEAKGVLYLLANTLERQAEQAIKRDPKTQKITLLPGPARALLQQAEPIYKQVAAAENEFAERAGRRRMRIVLTLNGNLATADPADLKTFDQLYLSAQVRLADLNDTVQKATEADRTEAWQKSVAGRYAQTVQALERALVVATPKDSARDKLEAQLLLLYEQLMVDQYVGGPEERIRFLRAAAEGGEKWAKSKEVGKSVKGLQAANYALRAWTKILAEMKAAGIDAIGPEKLTKEAVQGRTVAVAHWIEQTWPAEPGTDSARHQLAFLYQTQENPVEACKVLARITPNYAALAQARLDEGRLAYTLVRHPDRGKATRAERDECLRLAEAGLKALPDSATATAEAAKAICLGRILLGNMHLLAGKQDYEAALALSKEVQDKLPKLATLDESAKTEVGLRAQELRLYALKGKAAHELREGQHDKVAAILDPVLKEKPPAGDTKADADVRLVRGQVLMLALRSSVQQGQAKIARAREVLALLRQEQAGGGESANATLQNVVLDLQAQINEMKQDKSEKGQARLKQAVASFTAFLDDLANQPKVTTDILLQLGQGFTSLDQHAKAAEVLTKVLAAAPSAEEDEAFALLAKRPRNEDEAATLAEFGGRKPPSAEQRKQLAALKAKAKRAPAEEQALQKLEGQTLNPAEEKTWRSIAERTLSDAEKARLDALKKKLFKAGDGADEEKAAAALQRKVRNHRAAQFLLARAHRLAGQTAEADKQIKAIMGTSADKKWGFDNLEVRKEEIFLLEDQNKFREASEKWLALRKVFPLPAKVENNEDAARRSKNYEYYAYYLRCVQKSNAKVADPNLKGGRMAKLAGLIVKFEKSPGNQDLGGDAPRQLLQEMIDSDPLLRQQYAEAGGKVLTAAGNKP